MKSKKEFVKWINSLDEEAVIGKPYSSENNPISNWVFAYSKNQIYISDSLAFWYDKRGSGKIPKWARQVTEQTDAVKRKIVTVRDVKDIIRMYT